ncbi:MAG: sulfite exporter TauE/SafE family protein [Francisellaceae bacterium]
MLTFIVIAFCIALAGGIISGVFGGGSGLIYVPGFFYLIHHYNPFASHQMQVAIASCVCSSVLLGVVASIKQLKYRQVSLRTLKWFSPLAIVGGAIGISIVSALSSSSTKLIFALIILMIAIWMWRKRYNSIHVSALSTAFKSTLVILAGMATMLSGVSAFFVPSLIKCGLDIKKAIGTSTLVTLFISLVMSLLWVLYGLNVTGLPRYTIGFISYPIVIVSLIPSIIGALIGARLSYVIKQGKLQVIYISMMFIIAFIMLT